MLIRSSAIVYGRFFRLQGALTEEKEDCRGEENITIYALVFIGNNLPNASVMTLKNIT